MLHCQPQTGLPREKLVFFGSEWECELCLEPMSRSIGMGARESFPPKTAMIFVHPNSSVLSFWMKDCLVDMDMVFVDATGTISAMHEAKLQTLRRQTQTLVSYEAGLKRYGSNRRAKYVIELPAGTLAALKAAEKPAANPTPAPGTPAATPTVKAPALGDKIAIDWAALDKRAK